MMTRTRGIAVALRCSARHAPRHAQLIRRARHQHEQHDQAGSEQPQGTRLILRWQRQHQHHIGASIDGDMYKPSDIVTRNSPSESPSPEFQHHFVKKTSNPTQLLNSSNNNTKGFYRHTVGPFLRVPASTEKRDQTRNLISSVASHPIDFTLSTRMD